MRKRNIGQLSSTKDELTLSEIAETVESIFGTESVGFVGEATDRASDRARSAFVRTALYLIVKSRLGGIDLSRDNAASKKSKVTRDTREGLALFLGTDVNEVFRLHHLAAGLRVKDAEYRENVRMVERSLAERFDLDI